MQISTKPWKNWGNNQTCSSPIVTPKNVKELLSIIKKAKKERVNIHAYGSAHSWSDIVCVDGYLVNTDQLNKIVSVDKRKHQVTVQAGIKLFALNKELEKLGLCLPNQGAITKQSLAGVVSTATHGSGKTGTFASFVVSVQLATADAKLITISPTQNKDLWPAVRTSVGSLGIMTELTIQCQPLFYLKRIYKQTSWQQALKEYETLLDDNDYMEFNWEKEDDSVHIKIHNRIDEPYDITVDEKTKKASAKYSKNVSYKMLAGTLRVKYLEEEVAVPRKQFVAAAQAARKLVTKQWKKNHKFDAILFRFVTQEKDNLLSPAGDSDVVYFSIITNAKTGYESFYKEYYELLLSFGGRPHWGKINYLTHQDARGLYGKKLDAFIKVRKQLDPNGLFSNEFTQRIFGW
jgi:L-gulonolactone oxidase